MRLNFIQTAIMVVCVDCTSRVVHVFDSLAIRESEGRLRSIKISVADPNELIVTRNGITCGPIGYTVAENNRRIVLDPQSAHKCFSNGDEFSIDVVDNPTVPNWFIVVQRAILKISLNQSTVAEIGLSHSIERMSIQDASNASVSWFDDDGVDDDENKKKKQ